jgi:hypothetical protein
MSIFSLWQIMYAEVYQRELGRWITEREVKEMEVKQLHLMVNKLEASQREVDEGEENNPPSDAIETSSANTALTQEADSLAEAVSGLSIEKTSEGKTAKGGTHENWRGQRAVSGLGIFLQQLKGSGDSAGTQQSVGRSVIFNQYCGSICFWASRIWIH